MHYNYRDHKRLAKNVQPYKQAQQFILNHKFLSENAITGSFYSPNRVALV